LPVITTGIFWMAVMHKATKAIVMAAGIGKRLFPVTKSTPKPLIEINGRKPIETLLEGFIANGITEIYIVVGYLKEQFDYLPQKYQEAKLTLIENPWYDTCNNISSLYVARAYLGDCVITDGDMLLRNPDILSPYFESSGYCSTWASNTTEWLQQTDSMGYVQSCSRTGGENGWQLFSVSFWTEEDGKKLAHHLEEIFVKEKITDIYWDDIPMFLRRDKYRLKIREIIPIDLVEIDSLDDLALAKRR